MALRQTLSINPYQRGQSHCNRSRVILSDRARANTFHKVLSSFQGQLIKTALKTRGMTIADYRTRPVVPKSRRTPLVRQDMKHLLPEKINRISEDRPSVKIKKETNPTQASAPAPDTEKISEGRLPRVAGQNQPVLTDRQIITRHVQEAAAKYDLPPALIKGIIRAESNFEIRAVSRAGAQGLMQLMPATARELGVNNPFDIEQNINGGAKYLRQMLDRFGGNVRKALAAYNAGPGTVIKYSGRVPYPETRQYVKRVLRYSKQMA